MVEDTMIKYYTSENTIDPVWVDAKAQEAAKSLTSINSSQLRKFYADVKTLERQWISNGKDEAAFAAILPMFKLLKAKSAYALKRRVVPEEFKTWLWEHVEAVKTARDFKVFLLHFEAVVGFSYKGD